MTDIKKIQRFMELKQLKQQTDKELALLTPYVAETMTELGLDVLELKEVGAISLTPRRVYTFSDEIQKLEKEVKAKKKKEEQLGIASYETTHIITFKPYGDELS